MTDATTNQLLADILNRLDRITEWIEHSEKVQDQQDTINHSLVDLTKLLGTKLQAVAELQKLDQEMIEALISFKGTTTFTPKEGEVS